MEFVTQSSKSNELAVQGNISSSMRKRFITRELAMECYMVWGVCSYSDSLLESLLVKSFCVVDSLIRSNSDAPAVCC